MTGWVQECYIITDGLEGDAVKDPQSYFTGKRLKDGWRNSDSPLRDDEKAFAVFVDTSRHVEVNTIASLLTETSESDNRTHQMT